MDTRSIIKSLQAERGRLDKAIALLTEQDEDEPRQRSSRAVIERKQRSARPVMSAAARKKIGDAQRARWAKRKKTE